MLVQHSLAAGPLTAHRRTHARARADTMLARRPGRWQTVHLTECLYGCVCVCVCMCARVLTQSQELISAYEFLGWLAAQSILNRAPLGCPLPSVLFDLILQGERYKPTLAALAAFDPDAAKNVQKAASLPAKEVRGMHTTRASTVGQSSGCSALHMCEDARLVHGCKRKQCQQWNLCVCVCVCSSRPCSSWSPFPPLSHHTSTHNEQYMTYCGGRWAKHARSTRAQRPRHALLVSGAVRLQYIQAGGQTTLCGMVGECRHVA